MSPDDLNRASLYELDGFRYFMGRVLASHASSGGSALGAGSGAGAGGLLPMLGGTVDPRELVPPVMLARMSWS